MKSLKAILLLIKMAYVLFFVVVSLYLYIHHPVVDRVTIGVLNGVDVVLEPDEYTNKPMEFFVLEMESASGETKFLKGYNKWPIDTLLQYKGELLKVSSINPWKSMKRVGEEAKHHAGGVVRIQDLRGVDLPVSSPLREKCIVEYNVLTYIFYVMAFLLFVYIIRGFVIWLKEE